ncbi:hypothetical protein [Xanthomonas campestris]|uniref:hypothetical protein n=1 Tax=Xanthomonas campestris TaxID=339 RepID=UPI000E31EB1C|nr:hypothetical protein [Xanthomonas campestris]MCF8799238.1 hypothetical protein [Xanthomonas campestris pv. campestris]MCF8812180.1 hypothetical protein [Xanthomonas campestris pv. campestris]MEA9569628.1 hypothetical protein [Xanthomonas campestris]MEA9627453.1 hypothetical protein [Xanthomonas campestris]MEA9630862.1 hypothetical protein [Xanthomonas campestris]
MTEIEKRARELLAQEYERTENKVTASWLRDGARVGGMDGEVVLRAIIVALSAAPHAAPAGLADAAREALPFIAYAYSQGVAGAEDAGRAIESALAAHPEPHA